MDSPWASLYRPSIVTIPLSGLVSEIFSTEVPTMIIRDDVIIDVIRPGSIIREDHKDKPYRLKYRPIVTRIAGEEAF